MVEHISAVLVYATDLEASVRFYKDVLGVPLQESQHASESSHFECEIGDVHFAVFPRDSFSECESGRLALGLAVPSMDEFIRRLGTLSVSPLYPPVRRGFAVMTSLLDPDGTRIDITELSESWLQHLAVIRRQRVDQVARMLRTEADADSAKRRAV